MNRSLRFLYLTIRSIPYALSILFLCFLIWLFFYEFCLINVEPLFTGAYKLGLIFKNISIAYIVTYFFYFLIQINETKRRAKLYSPIFLLVLNLLRFGNSYFGEMFNSTHTDLENFENNDKYFRKILEGMNFEDEYFVAHVSNRENWIKTSRIFKKKIYNSIDHIREYKTELFPVRLTEILFGFEDSSYFHQLNNAIYHMKNYDPDDINEIPFGNKINELFDNFLELEDFANHELKPYIPRAELEKQKIDGDITLIRRLPQE